MPTSMPHGTISGILAFNIDRIARQPRDLERLIDIYEQARRPMIFATTAGDYDLTTADGRFQARIHVTVANKFSSDAAPTSSRPTEAGRGFNRKATQRTTGIRPAGRHARRRTGSRADQEGAQGRPARQNGRHGSPRVGGTGRTPVTGAWETVLSPDQLQELIEELDSRKQPGVGRKKGTKVTRRLLTGIARCARCGAALSSGVHQKGTVSYDKYGYHYYYCRVADGGCGGLSRSGPPVEDHVEAQLVARLRQQLAEARTTAPEQPELAAAKETLRQIEVDKAEARQLRADDLLSLAEFAREIQLSPESSATGEPSRRM